MRLVTFKGESGDPTLGIVRSESILDVNKWLGDKAPSPWTVLGLITAMAEPSEQPPLEPNEEPFVYDLSSLMSELRAVNDADLRAAGALVPLDGAVLFAPLPNPPSNVICMGRNYPEHAVEAARARGEEVPSNKPIFATIFTKSTSALNGPYSPIPYDSVISTQMDYEGELAIIIGKRGKNITVDEAMSHIFGYTILNDVTARDIQRRHGGQFFKGKSLDGSCPMGPWIVTADEIPDPTILEIKVLVNGELKQQDSVASMLFSIQEIIQEVSVGMTLQPGDIISTGTPAGVGFARNPQQFLRPGDVVECSITAIGTIRNEVRPVSE